MTFTVEQHGDKFVVIDTVSGELMAESGSEDGAKEVANDLNYRRALEDADAVAVPGDADADQLAADVTAVQNGGTLKGAKK